MILGFQLSWVALVAVLVSYICAVETLSEKELLAACEAMSNEQHEAPVRWDLLQIQPPLQLVTKALFLEYARIQCYFVDVDHKQKPGNAGFGQSSRSNDRAVSDRLCFRPQKLLQYSSDESFRGQFAIFRTAPQTRTHQRSSDELAC